MSAVQTIGFVGVGKIGMPISQNLIKNGYRVVGYRRSSLEEFEKIGGVPARSAAEVGAQADIVFSCLPSDAALEEVVQGPERAGALGTAGPGRGRARLLSGSGQATASRAARREGRRLHRWRGRRHAGHGAGAQGRDLSRRRRRRLQESRAGGSGASPTPASISVPLARPAASSSSTICWSPFISPPPRRRWLSASRPASTSTC